MENVLRSAVALFRPEAVMEETADYRVIGEIREVCAQMRALESAYDLICDHDLLEYNIYEQLAMSAKYRYLLRQAKKRNLACPPALFSTS